MGTAASSESTDSYARRIGLHTAETDGGTKTEMPQHWNWHIGKAGPGLNKRRFSMHQKSENNKPCGRTYFDRQAARNSGCSAVGL